MRYFPGVSGSSRLRRDPRRCVTESTEWALTAGGGGRSRVRSHGCRSRRLFKCVDPCGTFTQPSRIRFSKSAPVLVVSTPHHEQLELTTAVAEAGKFPGGGRFFVSFGSLGGRAGLRGRSPRRDQRHEHAGSWNTSLTCQVLQSHRAGTGDVGERASRGVSAPDLHT